MKHEPKTMKAKADLMLKKGSISETQHKKLHAKADSELKKPKMGALPPAKKVDALSAKGAPVEGGADDAADPASDATQTPAKRKAATKAPVMRGQPLDEDERDL